MYLRILLEPKIFLFSLLFQIDLKFQPWCPVYKRGPPVNYFPGVRSAHDLHILATAHEIAGELEKAVTLLDDALQIVEWTGERWLEADLYRLKGQMLLRQGCSEAADELYCKALSIAKKQEAKLWELRAAVSLARLRRDRGRRAEARNLLAPVYGWFTEGFDTPDLKEAKTLLDELTPSAMCCKRTPSRLILSYRA